MSVRWWAGRVRQFVRHLTGRVSRREREELQAWLTPRQLALFDAMHRADQRHGLDVVESLRRAGHDNHDLLMAGLLHDAGKGRELHVWHRVAWSLSERYGDRMKGALVRLPSFGRAFATLKHHPEWSAAEALAAGSSQLTADLIRLQHRPTDDHLAAALKLADEAN